MALYTEALKAQKDGLKLTSDQLILLGNDGLTTEQKRERLLALRQRWRKEQERNPRCEHCDAQIGGWTTSGIDVLWEPEHECVAEAGGNEMV